MKRASDGAQKDLGWKREGLLGATISYYYSFSVLHNFRAALLWGMKPLCGMKRKDERGEREALI